jgi:DNA-binding NtrC family response regulator
MEAIALDFVDEGIDAIEDEVLAATSATTVLITAGCAATVERLARRIHAASDRAAFPFVRMAAASVPLDPAALTETCADLLDAASGGSVLLTDVEHTPAIVQDRLMETFAGLHATRGRPNGIRLIAGTTTLLYERVTAVTFSDRLFYRLYILQIVARAAQGRRIVERAN